MPHTNKPRLPGVFATLVIAATVQACVPQTDPYPYGEPMYQRPPEGPRAEVWYSESDPRYYREHDHDGWRRPEPHPDYRPEPQRPEPPRFWDRPHTERQPEHQPEMRGQPPQPQMNAAPQRWPQHGPTPTPTPQAQAQNQGPRPGPGQPQAPQPQAPRPQGQQPQGQQPQGQPPQGQHQQGQHPNNNDPRWPHNQP